MAHQNMAPRHTEYFKLKSLRKWQKQEGLSELPLSFSEAGHKTVRWEVLFQDLLKQGGKENLYLQEEGEESEWAGLAKLPHLTTLSSYSLSHHISPRLSTLEQT